MQNIAVDAQCEPQGVRTFPREIYKPTLLYVILTLLFLFIIVAQPPRIIGELIFLPPATNFEAR